MNKQRKIDFAVRNFELLCRSVGSQYSNKLLAEFAHAGMAALKAVPLNVHEYDNAQQFGADYLVYSYLRKYKGREAKGLKAKAVASFKENEARLITINRRFRSVMPNGVEGILSDARRKIWQILKCGENGKFPLEEFARRCDWGPGATSSLTADDATVDKKILEPKLSVTTRAVPVLLAYLRYDTSWCSARYHSPFEGRWMPSCEFQVTEDSRFNTVDKDWDSVRAIDIQPTANLFLQKGVGSLIRSALQRCGIDLDDQSRNQSLARIAFQRGLATIDLAKASDSICFELVRALMPPDWFAMMERLRTPTTRIDDESFRLAKFSAMGNGYTFELESLIFYALCWAVVRSEGGDHEGDIGVYGDDLIVPQRFAPRLIEVLGVLGFETNVSKTFISGPFFESCGKHFFKGTDVTPIFQKEVICDVPSAIRAANRLFRWALQRGEGLLLDSTVFNVWSITYAYAWTLNRSWQRRKGDNEQYPVPVIPHDSVDDVGLLLNKSFPFNKHGVLRMDVISFVALKQPADHYALFANALRIGVEVREPNCMGFDPHAGLPTRGFVSPRGQGRYLLQSRKFYRRSTWVPAWFHTITP